jgi:uncharacterized protein (DUF433 family)
MTPVSCPFVSAARGQAEVFPRKAAPIPERKAVASGTGTGMLPPERTGAALRNTVAVPLASPTIVADPVPVRDDGRGTIRVGSTRITLDLVVSEYKQGSTPEEMVQSYDVLDLADVYAAIAYYLRHQRELDDYLNRRDQEAARIRQVIEANQRPGPTKEELLRRWAERNKGRAPPGQ